LEPAARWATVSATNLVNWPTSLSDASAKTANSEVADSGPWVAHQFAMTRSSRSLVPAALTTWLAFAIAGGCAQPSAVGGTCDLGAAAASASVTISDPALECEGRVCMQVGSAPPLCSAACRNDDDCRNVAPSGEGACHQGFTCAVPTAVGTFACRHLCVCRDNLPDTVACLGGG
jgi:hypothetical protein